VPLKKLRAVFRERVSSANSITAFAAHTLI
jgi:hypothetical protein